MKHTNTTPRISIRSKIVAVVAATGLAFSFTAMADDGHELIEKAMKEGHKGKTSIVAKIKDGSASKAEIEKLQKFYQEMSKVKPPRGDAEAWKKKTTQLANLTGKLAGGDEKAKAPFEKAVNCKACHEAHKPEKKK